MIHDESKVRDLRIADYIRKYLGPIVCSCGADLTAIAARKKAYDKSFGSVAVQCQECNKTKVIEDVKTRSVKDFLRLV